MEFKYPQATSLGKNMNITNKWSNIMIIKSTKLSVPGQYYFVQASLTWERFQTWFQSLFHICVRFAMFPSLPKYIIQKVWFHHHKSMIHPFNLSNWWGSNWLCGIDLQHFLDLSAIETSFVSLEVKVVRL